MKKILLLITILSLFIISFSDPNEDINNDTEITNSAINYSIIFYPNEIQ